MTNSKPARWVWCQRRNSNERDWKLKRKRSKLTHAPAAAAAASASNKDPTADTSFLPDRARDQEEQILRAQLEESWKLQQEKTKKELIQVTYSYWDGSGHRNQVVVPKG